MRLCAWLCHYKGCVILGRRISASVSVLICDTELTVLA